MEGGALTNNNTGNSALKDTSSLRKSLYKIFAKLLEQEVGIELQMAGPNKNAVKMFVKPSSENLFLFVDLDKAENKDSWFTKIETEMRVSFDKKKGRVFFMIREMEAWILKQPEAIEKWGRENKYHLKTSIASHHTIAGKDIETIVKPSGVLNEIIQQYFTDIRGKKIRYGKLKTAPNLLKCLDVKQLKNNDSEINRFYEYIIGKKDENHSAETLLPPIQDEPEILKAENTQQKKETIEEHTSATYEIGEIEETEEEKAIKYIVHLAGGNYLKAIELIKSSEETRRYLELFISIMRNCWKRDVKNMRTESENFAGLGREKQKSFLSYAGNMIRENFFYRLNLPEINYLNQEEAGFAKNFSPYVNENNVIDLINELALAERHIESNVNSRMVFFDLSMKIAVLIKK